MASTGSTGDSYDNAMAESINGLYKAEVIHRKSWKNCAEVELATLTWGTGITIDDCREDWVISLRQKQKKFIMLPSETMIWQPESQIKHSPGKPGRFTQISIMALQENCKNEAECTTQSRPQPNHLFCTKPGGHVRVRIQSCNHSLMSEQRKPGKRGVISYRWSMFTEIKNHLHTEVAYKCTKSETQQILEAVIMLLIILQHHTLHTKLSLVGTHFGFFIFRNKKIRATRPG